MRWTSRSKTCGSISTSLDPRRSSTRPVSSTKSSNSYRKQASSAFRGPSTALIKGFSRENQGALKVMQQSYKYTPRHDPGRYALRKITAALSQKVHFKLNSKHQG